GLLNVTRVILPLMVARDRGHVVNIGSTAGHLVYPKGNVYNSTKFAVRALNQGMSLDLVGTRIRVSSIDPGAVETELSEVRVRGERERAKKGHQGYTARSPADVAEAVCYGGNAHEHVKSPELVTLPTAQRNAYVWHREES